MAVSTEIYPEDTMKYRVLVATLPLLPLALTACSTAEEDAQAAETASSATPTSSALPTSDRTAGPAIEINLDGDLKPGAELTVSTPCTEEDTSATAVASFGGSTTLHRQGDTGPFVGTFTAPINIDPGPNGGPHIITVTCDSGANSTIAIPSAGNGDTKAQDDPHQS
ncbi:hypothetical protein H7347_09435 [Corynebacterium sp. zg-331]|uniref:hypothetical protein n=1 Tax=unclassified Corynebacterium TaxID=2624378 RepID=UPI00128D3878|nr:MULTISPECIES: hypothetical protein [unclassified Corynebacterium]MBC3186784.1 hypothetical protein [Corynebacterium sp. zg-331]MPV53265.1 hypothetical protein [Corynebacterium sp. zg331]